MLNDLPDHHDADLIIKLYDLRREGVMRESRTQINSKYWPTTVEEAVAVTKLDHPLNAAFRQTVGYWEMVFGMARHGIVHADYLIENSGEGLFLFSRVEPYLAQLREASSQRAFRNAEWVSKNCEMGRVLMEGFRARIAKAAEVRARS
jgi:hypothetical protein